MPFPHLKGKVKALRFENSRRSARPSAYGATTGHYFTVSKDFCTSS